MEHPCCRRLAFSALALGTLLFAGATACSSSGLAQRDHQAAVAECSSYKVGEVRGAYRGEITSIQRRMGGDFVVTRPDTPGPWSDDGRPQTFTVEVFRYTDSRCARRRR
jgi:hypothetical protein